MQNPPFHQLRERLLDWFDRNHRPLPWRDTQEPYHIWVSEVMLQQTQVNTVLPYYARFLKRFPDLESLARADLTSVLKAWEGLGYYARARNLHKAAREVMAKHGGRIPDRPSDFSRLPGAGAYITAAVQSIAFARPMAVVDGNVKRVLSRLFQIDTPVNRAGADSAFRESAERLLDPARPGQFNQALMEIGALICRPRNPDCGSCPLSPECRSFRYETCGSFPRRDPPRKIPERRMATGVVFHGGRFLITRRKPQGLLGGLWEFPGTMVEAGETPQETLARTILQQVGLAIEVGEQIARIRHAYTHFKAEIEVFQCRKRGGEIRLDGPVDFSWILLEEIDAYPFPKANQKFIPLLKGKRFH